MNICITVAKYNDYIINYFYEINNKIKINSKILVQLYQTEVGFSEPNKHY